MFVFLFLSPAPINENASASSSILLFLNNLQDNNDIFLENTNSFPQNEKVPLRYSFCYRDDNMYSRKIA